MAKVICPVCTDSFDREEGASTTYKGKRYFMCGDNCRIDFKGDPDGYVAAMATGEVEGMVPLNKTGTGAAMAAVAGMASIATAEALVAALLGKGGPLLGDAEIIRSAEIKKILLPQDMSLNEAAEWIQRKIKEEETIVNVSKIMPAFPMDGARAFMLALKDIYGWTDIKGSHWGTAPQFIQIDVGYKKTEDIAWGKVQIPGLEGELEMTTSEKDEQYFFCIGGKVKRKHLGQVDRIAQRTIDFINSDSIYRGKALRLEFTEKRSFFGNEKITRPEFLEPTTLTKDDLVLPMVTWKEVNAGVFTMIEKFSAAKRLGIPTKRANLFTGPFGTGKTLAATISSDLCIKNGRTFIYVAQANKLVEAIAFARHYAPAMIFVEDIDLVLSGERDEQINQILNTIDGADTKSLDILFVLTSNKVEDITAAFLRTGRSDMIIRFMPPDADAAARLIRRYGIQQDGRNILLVDNDDLLEVGTALAKAQLIPADIREVVERSKLFALAAAEGDDDIFISKDDLLFASNGVISQVELNRPKEPPVPAGFEYVGAHYVKKDGVKSQIEALKEVHAHLLD